MLDDLCKTLASSLDALGVSPDAAHNVFLLIWQAAYDRAEGQEEAAMEIVSDWLGIEP